MIAYYLVRRMLGALLVYASRASVSVNEHVSVLFNCNLDEEVRAELVYVCGMPDFIAQTPISEIPTEKFSAARRLLGWTTHHDSLIHRSWPPPGYRIPDPEADYLGCVGYVAARAMFNLGSSLIGKKSNRATKRLDRYALFLSNNITLLDTAREDKDSWLLSPEARIMSTLYAGDGDRFKALLKKDNDHVKPLSWYQALLNTTPDVKLPEINPWYLEVSRQLKTAPAPVLAEEERETSVKIHRFKEMGVVNARTVSIPEESPAHVNESATEESGMNAEAAAVQFVANTVPAADKQREMLYDSNPFDLRLAVSLALASNGILVQNLDQCASVMDIIADPADSNKITRYTRWNSGLKLCRALVSHTERFIGDFSANKKSFLVATGTTLYDYILENRKRMRYHRYGDFMRDPIDSHFNRKKASCPKCGEMGIRTGSKKIGLVVLSGMVQYEMAQYCCGSSNCSSTFNGIRAYADEIMRVGEKYVHLSVGAAIMAKFEEYGGSAVDLTHRINHKRLKAPLDELEKWLVDSYDLSGAPGFSKAILVWVESTLRQRIKHVDKTLVEWCVDGCG